MKAIELRQSILQAAVQGKLIPHNPNDEPAAELLKRIQQEKDQLIKEGKIKKEKPLPPIDKDETPFDLPDGWAWCRLGTICTKLTDGTHQRPDYVTEGFPFLSVKNISSGYIDFSNIKYVSLEEHQRLYARCNPERNDILLTKVGTTGVPVIVETDTVFDLFVSIALLKYNTNFIIPAYLKYLLCSPLVQLQAQENTRGVGNKNWVLKDIASTIIIIPPLAEQYRIVDKLNKLIPLCDKLDKEEKKLDKLESHFTEYLPKTILQAAIQGKLIPQNPHDESASELLKRIQQEKAHFVKAGKLKNEKPLPPITEDEIPYDLPEGWVWCRLGNICNYGSTQNVSSDKISDDSWILELEDIEKDTGKLLCKKKKAQRYSLSTKHFFCPNDILYSKLRPYLNKVLIAEDYGYCSSEILPLSFYKEINVRYILRFLQSPLFVDYANKCSYGVKMPRLGTNDGKIALVPLPPLAEQQRIVAKVDKLMSLCSELKATYTAPIKLSTEGNAIPFWVTEKEEETLLAARGNVEQLSSEAMQAIDDLFAEDDE